jgi:N-methylhydantoinase B/oxoprolinase/acetone carboxylase alpha subunit
MGHDAVFSLNGDRASTPPFGLLGGKPGATASCYIRRSDGTQERIAPRTMKAERVTVSEGDVLVIDATSGAGYGNSRREPISCARRPSRNLDGNEGVDRLAFCSWFWRRSANRGASSLQHAA